MSLFIICKINNGNYFIGEGNGNPLQSSCLDNPRDGGAWWAVVYGVAQSQTWLKWLSSSSSSSRRERTFYIGGKCLAKTWSSKLAKANNTVIGLYDATVCWKVCLSLMAVVASHQTGPTWPSSSWYLSEGCKKREREREPSCKTFFFFCCEIFFLIVVFFFHFFKILFYF